MAACEKAPRLMLETNGAYTMMNVYVGKYYGGYFSSDGKRGGPDEFASSVR